MAKDRDGGSQAQFDALCKGSQDHAVHLCGVCALCLCGQFDKDEVDRWAFALSGWVSNLRSGACRATEGTGG